MRRRKLADVLRCHPDPSSPAVVYYVNGEASNDDDNDANDEDEIKLLQVLTYEAAHFALQQHEEWLQALIIQEEQNGVWRRNQQEGTADDTYSHSTPRCCLYSEVVVIAYLSNNSTDLMLSILSAASSNITRTSSSISTTLSESKATQLDSGSGYFHQRSLTRTLPALLNTRWSAQEMINALDCYCCASTNTSSGSSSYSGTTITSNETERTLLLYGPGMEQMAQQVVQELSHPALAKAIPTFCQRYIHQYDHASTTPAAGRTFTNRANKSSLLFSPRLKTSIGPDSSFRNFYSERKEKFKDDDSDAEDALVIFTSGTTSSLGGSKGVRLSHRGLLQQAMAKLGPPCLYSAQTHMLATTVPFFHVGGFNNALAVWMAGGAWVFPLSTATQRRNAIGMVPLQDHTFLRCKAFPVTTLVVVPTMMHTMMQHIDNDNTNVAFPMIELILIGGQSASPTLVTRIRRVFPNARIVQTYACTEASSSLTFLLLESNADFEIKVSLHDARQQLTGGICVGAPPSNLEVQIFRHPIKAVAGDQILRPESLMTSEPFSKGIIATRGHHVMNGYWTRGMPPQRPTQVRSASDWFLTNDLGYWNEHGQLFFLGRIGDVIRTGGETVLSAEVERVLLQHPQIEECAVFAMPDDEFGHVVCAAVVLARAAADAAGVTAERTANTSNDMPPGLSQLRAWCQQRGLARYKGPRKIFYVSDLPRNSSGKILKNRLVERFGKKSTAFSKL